MASFYYRYGTNSEYKAISFRLTSFRYSQFLKLTNFMLLETTDLLLYLVKNITNASQTE